jgi:cell division protein FtsL
MRAMLVTALGAGILGSALAVVYTKHETRRLIAELQTLQAERDRMDVEWGRLQLEQSTLATHGRIEAIAHEKLRMSIPAQQAVVMVER